MLQDTPNGDEILDDGIEILASDGLCMPCFDIVINRCLGNETAGEKERKYIEEHCSEKEWKAE